MIRRSLAEAMAWVDEHGCLCGWVDPDDYGKGKGKTFTCLDHRDSEPADDVPRCRICRRAIAGMTEDADGDWWCPQGEWVACTAIARRRLGVRKR